MNAQSSLYAAPAAGTRRQEVLTPEELVAAARAALGGTIELDPCASSDPAEWFATHNLTVDPRVHAIEAAIQAMEPGKARTQLGRARKALYLSGLSLSEDWDGMATYVNPPFEFLDVWLEKIVEQAACGAHVVALFPARSRRLWWCEAVARAVECYALGAVTFKGEPSGAPFDLVAAAWGHSKNHLANTHLGDALVAAGVRVNGEIKVTR